METSRLTRAERAARGKAARAVAPRSSHAEFARPEGAPSPLTLLAGQDETRVPELLPIRYARMAASAFTYFRGAALPMAADLARTPSTGLEVQVCGDAHLMNFGLFASPERRMVFDINDFDETLRGPWEWDVKRLAASLEIAARDNGYPAKRRTGIVVSAVAEYRRAMREFSGWTALRVWYAHADVREIRAMYADKLGASRRENLKRDVRKAGARNNLGALRRFAHVREGRLCIAAEPPLIVPVDQLTGTEAGLAEGGEPGALTAMLGDILSSYRATLEPERRAVLDRYRYVDLARKVVGVGSVGTRCWMALLLGNDEHDPLFLQAKEAGPSVLERFVGPSRYRNAGKRVVVGQRLMQTVSDVFLGWVRADSFDGGRRDFYFRQLRDGKGSADVESMTPKGMLAYGRLCGWTLARAHARTGDPVALAAYLGSGARFEEAIGEFARGYADQNERDHVALRERIASGSIAAAEG
ncbi:hypothetical protein BAY61_14840 [Prauserella marina]|uniref:Uncharacterized conserved protein, DUF2252 family n=1 Tax=Prauserella marina TaxID=530584 RepID=A0A222VQ77_9PSEU|nr:DUF2252 domain-containing protein [Prauserella marina]ASR36068.1 hypothetical protein BAY61_14840 [Prauserella marina]PWV76795.1 uncharacterized protein (DUF2252 family) [Prauserella marina]SDC97798.1 Uncharacterized conserved protein, DUF2252 family [Prauserella marina]